MKDKYKYLIKNVLLFSLNGFIPKALAFIMVPLYTGYLSTYEYGISDLITVTVQLLLPIFSLDIQDAVMRYALDKDFDNKDVFSVAIVIIIKGSSLLGVLLLFISFSPIDIFENQYLLFVWLMFVLDALSNSFSLFCRGIDQVKVLVVASTIKSIMMLSCNILFLVYFKWGLTGYIIANLLGIVASVLYMFFKARLNRYVKLKNISQQTAKDMKKFSFPLIFSVMSWWVNSASDKYIVSWIAGVSVSGIYAVSYITPNILTTFQNIFAQAWSISAVKEFDKNDQEGFFSHTYEMMNFGMVVMCSICMIINIPLAKILFAKEFFEAWRYVPPLLFSVVFNAMALFIGNIFTAVKDTKTLSYSTILGALVNTVCNVIFIYLFGAYGAAIATLLGYGVVFIIRRILLNRYITLKINEKRNILSYFILLIQMAVASAGYRYTIVQCVLFFMITLCYYQEVRKLKR